MTKKRSLMGRVYRAYRSFFEPLHRVILPLSTGKSVLPNQVCHVKGRVQNDGFWPDRLTISSAGTNGGAADWIVNDLKVNNRSQFIQSGDVPGDLFATEATHPFINFEAALAAADVDLIVTYIGKNEEGCPLFASITGMEYDPGLLDIIREAISQALSSASRGFSTRPHPR